MKNVLKVTAAVAALIGAAALSAPAAQAAEVNFGINIGGIAFSYDSGGYCDRWGCPDDYWDMPIYDCPVFYDGQWYRGPVYYRRYGGHVWYWIHGDWRRDQWRGPRPAWACVGRYRPALGFEYYERDPRFRIRDEWRRRWHERHGNRGWGHDRGHDRGHGHNNGGHFTGQSGDGPGQAGTQYHGTMPGHGGSGGGGHGGHQGGGGHGGQSGGSHGGGSHGGSGGGGSHGGSGGGGSHGGSGGGSHGGSGGGSHGGSGGGGSHGGSGGGSHGGHNNDSNNNGHHGRHGSD